MYNRTDAATKVYLVTVCELVKNTYETDPDSPGMICLYSGKSPRYKETSEMLGYGLKIVIRPTKDEITNNGCSGSRMVRAPT